MLAGAEPAGDAVLVVGLGSIGAKVARLAKALAVWVIAVNRPDALTRLTWTRPTPRGF